jgi:hypothetical protein
MGDRRRLNLSVTAGRKREARLLAKRSGHPRLLRTAVLKAWMRETSPGMPNRTICRSSVAALPIRLTLFAERSQGNQA